MDINNIDDGEARREAQRRVALAIEALDEYAPEGWDTRIELDQLSMMSYRWCVLGQVYEDEVDYGRDSGAYYAARHLLRDQVGHERFDEFGEAFANYRDEWARQVTARREAARS